MAVQSWIDNIYNSIDYEAVLFAGEDGEEELLLDDSGDEFIYGECDLRFFLPVLSAAYSLAPHSLDASDSGATFIDLGGGKGQLALAAARTHSTLCQCVSLELVPELHHIGAAAAAVAAAEDPTFARVANEQGDIYCLECLSRCGIDKAAVVFAYATKFSSEDGEHATQLSSALAASELPDGCCVVTINRKLHAKDGWVQARPELEGPTPHETAEVGIAYFWRRATKESEK